MHALRIVSKEHPEISHDEIPVPEPGIGDVIVEVKAASFTPTELEWPSTWVDRAGHDRAPIVPGHEVSGVVRSLGYGTTGFAPGDEVFGITDWYRDGAMAEYVAVEARNLAGKPASLSHVDAAAVSLAGLTAHQGLFVHGGLRTGQTVVITGASGGVGALAVQLARDADARVVAVAHRWAHPLLSDLGAEVLVEPDESATSREDINADLLFDLVGGDLEKRWAARLRPGGTEVSAVEADPNAPEGGRAVFFVVEPHPAQLRQLAGRVEAGRIRPVIGRVESLADRSHKVLGKGAAGVPGKVVWETG